jgi:hypothetical protein
MIQSTSPAETAEPGRSHRLIYGSPKKNLDGDVENPCLAPSPG